MPHHPTWWPHQFILIPHRVVCEGSDEIILQSKHEARYSVRSKTLGYCHWFYWGLGYYYVLFAWLYQFSNWYPCLENFLWYNTSYFSKDDWSLTILWLDISNSCFPLRKNRYFGLAFMALVIHLLPCTFCPYPLTGLQRTVRPEQRSHLQRPLILTKEPILIIQWEYGFSVKEQRRTWRHSSCFWQKKSLV